MLYEFPQDIQERVEAQLSAGRYGSEDDVLRDAMAALEERSADLAAIEAGMRDEQAGRVRPLAEVDDAMRAKYGIPRQP